MLDLKVINSVLDQMEEERGISREKMLEAVEQALATAYKKEYGKRGQIVRANFDIASGTTTFDQIKIAVDETMVRFDEEEAQSQDIDDDSAGSQHSKTEETQRDAGSEEETETRVRFDPEKHILIDDARRIKKDVELGEELVFPLEARDDFGRIAAQTAKQVIIQKIREAEKESALTEFGQKEGEIILGHVQRFERGSLYIDLGRVTGVMPYEEQIPGERYRPGERIRALLLAVEETPRGIFLKLSRAHPDFLEGLFAIEAPELQNKTVEVKAIAREAGSRSKIAVHSTDEHIDPVGSLVGQRGVRVSTVMSELGGEKIDIIEWSDDSALFIEDALSPAQVLGVTLEERSESEDENDDQRRAVVEVASDQQSLAIGRGGQNVRLAAKLTGWKIDIVSVGGDELAVADGDAVEVKKEAVAEPSSDETANEAAVETAEPDIEEKDEEVSDEKKSETSEDGEVNTDESADIKEASKEGEIEEKKETS